MTYETAKNTLGNRARRRLAGTETYLERDGDCFAVVYRGTKVVTINPDGTYTLSSGGWRTVTTKRKINAYAPVRVYQSNFDWYVGNNVEFFDGITVDSTGRVVSKAA